MNGYGIDVRKFQTLAACKTTYLNSADTDQTAAE